MKVLLTGSEIAIADKFMMKKIPSKKLMEDAAEGVMKYICKKHVKTSVNVFCGTGNNGGDGFAVSRLLMEKGYKVKTYILGELNNSSKETKQNFKALRAVDVVYVKNEECIKNIKSARIIVDAIFGVGLNREITGVYADVIRYLNKEECFKVAIDIPSGLGADKGNIWGIAFRAHATITFQHKKIGQLAGYGRNLCGELHLVKIGDDKNCNVLKNADIFEFEKKDFILKKRDIDVNKGDYGKLVIVAGSDLMSGAAFLTAKSAVKSGVGLVNVASVDKVLDVVRYNLPEVVLTRLKSESIEENIKTILNIPKTALAIGPGLSCNDDVARMVISLLCEDNMPKIIDADGLNVISKNVEVLKNKQGDIILSPHLKEFSRLIGRSVSDIKENMIEYSREFANKYGVVVLLKGATTLITSPLGKTVAVSAGSSGMAKGGSGDVLTGVIGGLLAQGYSAFESGILGAYICGRSGEKATKKYGVYSCTPKDTANMIFKITKKVKQESVSSFV